SGRRAPARRRAPAPGQRSRDPARGAASHLPWPTPDESSFIFKVNCERWHSQSIESGHYISSQMRKVKSCGVLVFRAQPAPAFLLPRHASRFDLPKGHSKRGETELQCALRELEEETGLGADGIVLDRGFRCEQVYYPRYQRFGGAVV